VQFRRNLPIPRAEQDLDIDMRIGVHSGTLFAGVIGQAKLQFDIWGKPSLKGDVSNSFN